MRRSEIPDEVRAGLTHVMRGAEYRYWGDNRAVPEAERGWADALSIATVADLFGR